MSQWCNLVLSAFILQEHIKEAELILKSKIEFISSEKC